MNDAKLILSKKGFDSTYGRGPSPILADGRTIPLPIPEPRPGVCAATYGALRHDEGTYADLLARLGFRIEPHAPAHLDPDLIPGVRPRDAEWRGMFGQVDQAESHLANKGVGPGSLFLFWGWYEHVDATPFSRSAGFSSLFGYLEVDRVLDIGTDEIPSYARHHPHCAAEYPQRSNRIYVARPSLSWNPRKPGWGVFRFAERLRLNTTSGLRSTWRLPGCFHPESGCVLSYNTDPARWGAPGITTELRIPARGQEFVCDLSPSIAEWVRTLIDESRIWSPASHSPPANKPPTAMLASVSVGSPRQRYERATEVPPSVSDQSKSIPAPLPGERVVAYGDRLLWRQLDLQKQGQFASMLTEEEYVGAVLLHFPEAREQNVRRYRSYFNGRHASMGFRDGRPQPIPVTFAPPRR